MTDTTPVANDGRVAQMRFLRHELRTPLHAVLGFAELLGTRSLDDDARGYLEQIRSAAQRLQTIVDGIS
ncbi:MAG: histidine kinase dimerization/phospho-acceptor domain-containing protein [Actinomycetes bacterium]